AGGARRDPLTGGLRRLAARARPSAEPGHHRRSRGRDAAGRADVGDDVAMRVLVVAVSARMIAQLAVADGYEVTALDRFGDVDLRAIAPCSTAANNDALTALAADVAAEA